MRITYGLVKVRFSIGVPNINSVRRRPLIRVKIKIVERSKVSNKLSYFYGIVKDTKEKKNFFRYDYQVHDTSCGNPKLRLRSMTVSYFVYMRRNGT